MGNYSWVDSSAFLDKMLDWLDNNADQYQVERWFLFVAYKDIVNIDKDGYMGITLFSGPEIGSSINCLGNQYKSKALGLSEVVCGVGGATIPKS